VEYARNHGVTVHVRSSFTYDEGTWVMSDSEMDEGMEAAMVTGVAHDSGEGKLVIRGVPDKPGIAARIFTVLAANHINVDMIVQNVSESGATDISCTLPLADGPKAVQILRELAAEVGAAGVDFDEGIAKVSLVGAGMKTHPGVAAAMFEALSEVGVNIEMISTSTIRISVVIRESDLEAAVRAVHDRFNLAEADHG